MPIEFFNTLTGRKEPLQPAGDVVTMYVCGLTPKNHPHIGHAWLFVSVDVMRRWLEYRGYHLRHVQNFTDVDDKIIEAGHRDGVPPEEAAGRYIASYWKAMDALNVLHPTLSPYATHYIPQMIALIEQLIMAGYAYQAGGDVYFRAARFADYGRLSGNTLAKLAAGARVDVDEQKEQAADFALWKAAKPGEPRWDSPFSPGRPGWHIECSTIVRQELGEQIDVHWGGRDLIFPHHENEIAQSEAASGKAPFVHLWLHAGLMQTGTEKMAHSLGNFVTIHDMIERFGAEVLRTYLVSEHYRTPITFSEEFIARAEDRLRRLRSAARNGELLIGQAGAAPALGETFAGGKLADALREQGAATRAQFGEALDDDLNTPRAMAALEALAKQLNTANDAAGREPALASPELLPALREADGTFRELASLLGLTLTSAAEDGDAAIQALLDERTRARSSRDFATADRLRDELLQRGITIEDRPGGTIWYR
ncbi:MAG: cysteine--tRNA ligase [Chloroflexota bacterium]